MDLIRVLIVDDHRAFGDALAMRLDAEVDLEVVGTATDSERALRLAEVLQPDVVTLDVDLGPGGNGVGLSRAVLALEPPPRVVMVSCVESSEVTLEALRAGAVSWVSKDASIAELVGAVRGAVRDESYVPPQLLAGVLRHLAAGSAPPAGDAALAELLTPRELDVLRCLMAGMDRAAVARQLFLAGNTVRTHVQNLLNKLEAHSSLEAVAIGRRAGIEPWPDASG